METRLPQAFTETSLLSCSGHVRWGHKHERSHGRSIEVCQLPASAKSTSRNSLHQSFSFLLQQCLEDPLLESRSNLSVLSHSCSGDLRKTTLAIKLRGLFSFSKASKAGVTPLSPPTYSQREPLVRASWRSAGRFVRNLRDSPWSLIDRMCLQYPGPGFSRLCLDL